MIICTVLHCSTLSRNIYIGIYMFKNRVKPFLCSYNDIQSRNKALFYMCRIAILAVAEQRFVDSETVSEQIDLIAWI